MQIIRIESFGNRVLLFYSAGKYSIWLGCVPCALCICAMHARNEIDERANEWMNECIYTNRNDSFNRKYVWGKQRDRIFVMVETQQIQFCSRLSLSIPFRSKSERLISLSYNRTNKSNWTLQMYLTSFFALLLVAAHFISFNFIIYLNW